MISVKYLLTENLVEKVEDTYGNFNFTDFDSVIEKFKLTSSIVEVLGVADPAVLITSEEGEVLCSLADLNDRGVYKPILGLLLLYQLDKKIVPEYLQKLKQEISIVVNKNKYTNFDELGKNVFDAQILLKNNKMKNV